MDLSAIFQFCTSGEVAKNVYLLEFFKENNMQRNRNVNFLHLLSP